MTKPPAENLMDWPKGRLADEVARLRAILYEHAERPADDATTGDEPADIAPNLLTRGYVVIDTRRAVLLDAVDVGLVDTEREETPAIVLLLHGCVNMTRQRTKQLYMLGADAAAALVTQVTGVVQRAGHQFSSEFKEAYEQRMGEMQ